MGTLAGVASVALALAAAYVAAMNIGCAVANYRNKKRGVDKHHSMVPIAVQLLALASAAISSAVPKALLIGICLVDLSLWQLAYLPIFLLRRRLAGHEQRQ